MVRLGVRVVAVALGAMGLLTLLAGPAGANDLRYEFHSPYTGRLLAVATYDDLTDNYCVRHVEGHTNAVLRSTRPGGGGLVTKTDVPGGGASCTGNLSIPEDQYREVRISVAEWLSPPRYHYT